jgi:hypothetical protein
MQRKNFQIRKNIPIKPRENQKPGSEGHPINSAYNPNNNPEKPENNGSRNHFESPTHGNIKVVRRISENNENSNPRTYIQSRPVGKTEQNTSTFCI